LVKIFLGTKAPTLTLSGAEWVVAEGIGGSEVMESGGWDADE
jgi:hypothetical protein